MSGKQVKAERRGATRIEAIRPRGRPPQWPLLTIRILSTVGLLVGAYLTLLHVQAGASGQIEAPFCGTGTTINCTSVLGSTYARLFGLPVGGWAAATYALTLLVSFIGHPALLVLLCGWAFAFSLYMASLSLFVIQAACLFCMALYVVNIGLLVSAVALARSLTLFTGQQVIISALGYAVLVAGFAWFQAQSNVKVAAATTPIVAPAPAAVDMEFLRYYNSRPLVTLTGQERHTKGPTQALLTISEFVDFRCPQCALAREVLAQLVEGNPNDIRLIFRHYPLDSECNPKITHQVHPTSCAASIAAECAGEQGQFWEYAEQLFANQKEHTRTDLEDHARKLKLDLGRFQSCLSEVNIKDLVRKDIEEAERIGVKATPTLIINGHLIEGLPTPHKLASLVTAEKQRLGKK
ncbi:MAG: thioredoxin domain-containing protein [Candidatus Binatia bacterium]